MGFCSWWITTEGTPLLVGLCKFLKWTQPFAWPRLRHTVYLSCTWWYLFLYTTTVGLLYSVAETWRRVWEGDGKIVRGPRFLNEVFFGKNFHFHGQSSWWPIFSHWPGFSDFPFLFPDFPYLLCSMSYKTLSSQEQPLFQKRIPLWHLFLTQILGRSVPQSP